MIDFPPMMTRHCSGKRWIGAFGDHVVSATPPECLLSASLTSLPAALGAQHMYLGERSLWEIVGDGMRKRITLGKRV